MMKYQQLVVNGCSYMESYAKVDGLIFKIKAGVRDGMLPGHKQILMQ